MGCMETRQKGPVMTEQSRDRLEGKFDEAKGRGKEALGNLTDDKNKEMQGQKDQAIGKAKQGIADLKDKADDVMSDVRNRNDR
jgi:uncharacterized protein YjbJ (UPF0337 family)